MIFSFGRTICVLARLGALEAFPLEAFQPLHVPLSVQDDESQSVTF
jgi:hypothetical protein